MMKKIILVIAFLTSFSTVFAQTEDNMSERLNTLFEITQVKEMLPTMVNAIIGNYQKKEPSIPSHFWDALKADIDYNKFINESKQVYRVNYSEQEIDELIELYKPETIDTYKAKTKKVEAELYAIGRKFGGDIVKTISEKVTKYKRTGM